MIGKIVADRYEILELLGTGGMSTVYKAHNMNMDNIVAIKFIDTDKISPNALGTVRKRFEQEARSIANLVHPNIIRISDYGVHEGIPYFVMDYLPGKTLKEYLKKNGKPLSWNEAVQLIIPIARALAFAHGKNIIHRDIKPSNILLTESGEPIIADFGIAEIFRADSKDGDTPTGSRVFGTPEYMAPEISTGEPDHRVDIYALGIVLFELVTGRKPFVGDTYIQVLVKHINEPVPNLKNYSAGIPDSLDQLVHKALAKKPDDRYPDMKNFLQALEEISGKTLPPSPGPNWFKIIPRAIVVILILVGIGGLIGLGIYYRENVIFWMQSLQPAIESKTTPTNEISATPTSKIPSTYTDGWNGIKMVLVPAGDFLMGSDAGISSNENPIHEVYVDELIYMK